MSTAAIATCGKTNLEHILNFEFVLIYAATEMHSTDKPKLVEIFCQFSTTDFYGREKDVKYILDGGDLIYKMGDWKSQKIYHNIADQMSIICK